MKSLTEFIAEAKESVKNIPFAAETEKLVFDIVKKFNNSKSVTVKLIDELFNMPEIKPVTPNKIAKLGNNDICIGYNKKDGSYCLGIYNPKMRGFRGFQYNGTTGDELVYTTKKGYILSWEDFVGYTKNLKLKYIYFNDVPENIRKEIENLHDIYA